MTFLLRSRDLELFSCKYSPVLRTCIGMRTERRLMSTYVPSYWKCIWDTAGQERFRSVTHAYYRDAHVSEAITQCAQQHALRLATETKIEEWLIFAPTGAATIPADLTSAHSSANQIRSLALLLLYDVSNKTSFDNTRAWLGEINEYAQDDVVIMLIGNKADITQDRQVRTEDGERLARSLTVNDRVSPFQEYGVAFMETSAKTGCNVELAFMAVARELKQRASRSAHGASGRFNMTEYIRQESQAKPNGCCSS
ncbi:hypothetical protein HPB51_009969 [Rhipicephalus microplus]|uniref:Uncharacterized protein n=1 Tax=Rhipicephalus microplus TaxID=6941 RepID=A0A9J6ESR8_RHIMP|nr:hypothetical protein HPB51_009969 [Rhipicephalus microplus]